MRVTDEQIVTALLTAETNRKAAQSLGMTERHFYKRLQSESLQAMLRAAQEKILDDTVAVLRKNLTAAANVMASVMNDEKVPPQVRLNAADAMTKNYLRLSERADILDRLDRLEGLL